MNKEELTRKIMRGLRESLNESKAFDPKNNKDHKAAYNSFVKWYDRWKEKLGREEIRALVKKVSNDALGDNLDMINEAYKMPNPIINTYTGPLPKVDSDDNTLYDEKTGETIATMDIKQYGHDSRSKCCIIKFKPGLSLQDKLNYRDAILKNRTLKSWFNIGKSSFIYHQPELFESLNEARVPARIEDADQHIAEDIFLTYENTREIYDHYINPMADNLLIKLRKGKELSLDVLANSSIIEKHAKVAIDEYRRTAGRIMIDTATRKALKTKIAQYLINLANDDYQFELHDMESNLHK